MRWRGSRSNDRGSIVKAGFLAAGIAAAGVTLAAQQAPAPSASATDDRTQHIRVMEGVLMQAVRHGAELLGRRMQAMDPNLVLLTGSARARGFMLDGYGVFFDVEIPGVQQSVAWSMRMMQRDRDLDRAFRSLQAYVRAAQDQQLKAQLEQDLQRIQLLAPATSQQAAQGTQADAKTGGIAAANVAEAAAAPDPNEEYTNAVKDKLIDAMLEYSGPMKLSPDEWLTVAARDSEGPVVPGQLYDAMTIVLRVKGSDLAAYHAKQISYADARKRVEVREF
jgi:hypothetical protein